MSVATIAGVVIRADGTAEQVTLPRHDMLAELYRLTGAEFVERVALTPEIEMWVDEEGLVRTPQPPVNAAASALYLANHRGLSEIRGGAVFLGMTDDAGYSTSLDPVTQGALLHLAAEEDPYRFLLG